MVPQRAYCLGFEGSAWQTAGKEREMPMTEQEWLAATDPTPILEFLRGKASDRKLRLFACAVCRRLASLIVLEEYVSGIEAAESYVDGGRKRAAMKRCRQALDRRMVEL